MTASQIAHAALRLAQVTALASVLLAGKALVGGSQSSADVPSPDVIFRDERAGNAAALQPLPPQPPGDPFFHDRGTGQGSTTTLPADASDPLGALQLLGTVVSTSGRSFAVCRVGNGLTRSVRVGESVGEWVLLKIGAGSADFRATDGTVVSLKVTPEEGSDT